MTVPSLERALAAAQAWLARQDEPEAAIAAHEGRFEAPGADTRRWIRRILDGQTASGDWGGDLLRTAEALLAIHELRTAAGLLEQAPELGLGLAWLRARQGATGAWTGGCSPERHRRGACHHFMGGFFSPGPPEVPFEEAQLRTGGYVRGDAEVRFAASAIALRCVLQWGVRSADVGLHLDGLRRLVGAWAEHPPDGLSTTGLLAAIHALAVAGSPADMDTAGRGLRVVAGRQRGDGSWVDADAFLALEVLTAAADAGLSEDRSRRALWHGARLLVSTQHQDGSWGRDDYGARRTLIAWRTLRSLTPERE